MANEQIEKLEGGKKCGNIGYEDGYERPKHVKNIYRKFHGA